MSLSPLIIVGSRMLVAIVLAWAACVLDEFVGLHPGVLCLRFLLESQGFAAKRVQAQGAVSGAGVTVS